MQHFIFITNKKGMLHMLNILSQINETLKQFHKKKITSQVLKRFAIILLYLLEFKVKEISSVLKCSEKTAYQTIKKYRFLGILNILEKQRPGRRSLMSSEESTQLKKI